MIRLAVFDCDGTLADSAANIVTAMTDTFEGARLPPPTPEQIRHIVGLSLREAMAELLPRRSAALHGELAEGYKLAFQRMRARGTVEEPLFDGVVEALDGLEEAGWLLGVATGKSDRGLRLFLEHHGLSRRFVTLQTADRHPSKPHPAMLEAAMREAGAEPHGTVMIGDTQFDMAMADAAGVRGIGVAWGYHMPDELIAAGALAVATRPHDLLHLIQEPA